MLRNYEESNSLELPGPKLSFGRKTSKLITIGYDKHAAGHYLSWPLVSHNSIKEPIRNFWTKTLQTEL